MGADQGSGSRGGTGFRHNLCNLWLTCNKLPAGSCPNDGQETLISLKIIVDLKQPGVVAEAVPDLFLAAHPAREPRSHRRGIKGKAQ
jgi:hypothetical protein